MRISYLLMAAVLSATMMCGCSSSQTSTDINLGADAAQLEQLGKITVVSREEGSGTRDAFVEIANIMQKDSNGKSKDMTVSTAQIENSTDEVSEAVKKDVSSIGYGSFGSSKADGIKTAAVDGVDISIDNIKNGSYKLSRPFNIAYSGALNEVETDFMRYVMGKGQDIIKDSYVPAKQPEEFLSDKSSGEIIIDGSTSIAPLMEQLVDDYSKLNPNAKFTITPSDSTTGLTNAQSGKCDFAMASRELKDYEQELLTYKTIATDGIAVFLNDKNQVNNISIEQLEKIYTGKAKNWSDIVK